MIFKSINIKMYATFHPTSPPFSAMIDAKGSASELFGRRVREIEQMPGEIEKKCKNQTQNAPRKRP